MKGTDLVNTKIISDNLSASINEIKRSGPASGLSCGHKIGVVLWDEQTRVYRFRGFKIIAQGE
jgi:hypothetical protein